MKRGPFPLKGLDMAIPVAMKRGSVMLFQPLPEHVCDFTITGNGILALVRLMSAMRLHASIAEISRHYSDAVAGLCTVPFGGPVSRELWLYSRYGTLRFFRVTESGLVEIDGNGFPFVNGKPVISLPTQPVASPLTSCLAISGPGNPVPAVAVVTGPPGSGPFDPKSPIIRWLKKKNSGKKPGTEETGMICQADAVRNANLPDKQPTATKKQIPSLESGAPAAKPLAAGQTGLPDKGSPAREPDRLPVSGKTEGEK